MNEDWYFNVFDELVYISDINTYDLLYMNNICRKLAGLSEDEYQGLKCYKVLQGFDAPCPFCNNHLLEEDSIYKWEYSNPRFNRHFSLKDKIINWNGLKARLEIALDITDYKEQLLNTEQKMSSMLQSIPGGVCEVLDDGNFHVLWHNDHFLSIIGYTAEEFAKELKNSAAYVHEHDMPRVMEVMERVRTTGRSEMLEARVIRRDGCERILVVTLSYNPGRGGAASTFYSVGIDITDYRQEIERKTNALQDALEAAQQASQAKGRFLSLMSHEIRTPLNAVIGMSAIAGMSLEDKEALRNCHQKIDTSARYLLSLINDILDVSRIESGKMELTRQEFYFPGFLDEISAMFTLQAKARQIAFTMKTSPLAVEYLRGDPLRLKQVVVNLLSNALKFTPEQGSVTLDVTQLPPIGDDVGLRIRVQDTGIGIEPAARERIFNSFEQQDSAIAAHFGGSGLGLSLCRHIVELMGGNISVHSAPGQGSVFEVELTLKRGEAPELPEDEEHGSACDESFKGLRALVVEDNGLNQEIICTLLQMRGFEVQAADNGKQALDMFHDSPEGYFQVILMDILMPVMDGLEATRAIRALPRSDASLPIVALSANAFEEDRQTSLANGMNEHLAKPVDMEDLYRILGGLLQHDSPQ